MTQERKKALELMQTHRNHNRHLEAMSLDVCQRHAIQTVDYILEETLECYTNDENGDRVEFWRAVRNELETLL